MKQRCIRQGVLLAYVKSRLGYGSKMNTSSNLLAVKALAKDGFVKPQGVKDWAWIEENVNFIKANAPKLEPKVKKKRSKTTRANPVPSYAGDVNSPDFLQSYEWRSLRVKVLMKYGRRCMCCGASPDTGAVMNVDHIKPRRLFPHLALVEDNLQVLCHDCNHGKGNWLQHDFRPETEDVDPDVAAMIRSIARG